MTPHLAFFVDDAHALTGVLAKALPEHLERWRFSVRTTGREARHLLRSGPVDVVLTDLHFAGDGAEVLESVRALHPGAFRVVSTRPQEKLEAVSIPPVAHRMVAKPLHGPHLAQVLEDLVSLSQQLPLALRERLGGEKGIPPLPWTRLQLIDHLFRPDADLQHIGYLASQDMGLSARFLQLVNSELYQLARTVSDVSEAVGYLGLRAVRGIVVAAGVFDAKHATLPTSQLRELQQHSLRVARFAQELASRSERAAASTAGLLHDVGRVGIASLMRSTTLPPDVTDEEGLDHAQVGAYMLGAWGLPRAVVRAVGGHHLPQLATDSLDAAQAVAVAEHCLGLAASRSETPLSADPRWSRWLARAEELVRALPIEGSGSPGALA